MTPWKWHECLQVGFRRCWCAILLLIHRQVSIENLLLLLFKARLNDRDEIRRKLAAGNESEGENEDYYTSDYIKKSLGTASHRRRQGKENQPWIGTLLVGRSTRWMDLLGWRSSHRSWLSFAMRESEWHLLGRRRRKEEDRHLLSKHEERMSFFSRGYLLHCFGSFINRRENKNLSVGDNCPDVMAEKGNNETVRSLAGSNLQICFVNEHHQANETSESEMVSSGLI